MASAPSDRPRVLVAGVGNIFLGDDAFGVEVVQRLARRQLPDGVRVVDFGIRGLDLAYALLDPYEAVVMVDATPRGGRPGTLYVLEPGPASGLPAAEAVALIEPHNLEPARVLRLVEALGGQVRRLLVVGCEPAPPSDAGDGLAEMSAAVRAAVDEAVLLVESLIARLLGAASVGEENTIPEKEVPTCHPLDKTD
jgi:hydrogenase maturation protease